MEIGLNCIQQCEDCMNKKLLNCKTVYQYNFYHQIPKKSKKKLWQKICKIKSIHISKLKYYIQIYY